MTEAEPGSEQSAGQPRCPYCGAAADQSARYCQSCGRSLASPAPDVDIGGWVQAGWRLFVNNIPVAIGIPLIVVVPMIGFFFGGYFGFLALAMLMEQDLHLPKIALIIVASMLGLVALLLALAMPALHAGIYACFLDGLRSGRLTAGNILAGFRQWWACTWVFWMLGAAMVACVPFMLILVGIPAYFAIFTMLWLSLFRIVDRRRGGAEALSFAWAAMRGRLWVMLLYTFLMFILMNAGVMGFYFGIVVTAPIATAAMAAAYDSLSRKLEAPPQVENLPNSPG